MEIASITGIREKRDLIREKLKTLDKKKHAGVSFGSEKEYSFKGLLGGLEAMLIDISTLTKAPRKFVKISTYAERQQLLSNLSTIYSYLENPANYLTHFEALKVQLRNYQLRQFSERQLEFEEELENTLKIKLQLEQEKLEVKKIKEVITEKNTEIEKEQEVLLKRVSELREEVEAIVEKKREVIEHANNLEATNKELETIKEQAETQLEGINSALTESKSNEKLINSFAVNVQEKDKRLSELEQNTEENNRKLQEYEAERISILKRAEELIKSAKEALNYKTAEGISASFQEQYNFANNRWIFGGWITGAVSCLIATVLLGMWVLDTSPSNLSLLIGRISLLPLPVIGAIFCANQYTKQKNIIEDYAYKMVLSKAIVGFSEQLKKHGTDGNEEYIHYIKTALEEIHRDPLRKRGTIKEGDNPNNSNFNELFEIAERIRKISGKASGA